MSEYIFTVWIGPPVFDKGGHDVFSTETIDNFSKNLKNIPQKVFFCQSAYKAQYEKYFREKNISVYVMSVEDELNNFRNSQQSQQWLKAVTNDIQAIYAEIILNNERNTIRDRVSFKVIMSFWCMAIYGGYYIDSNVYAINSCLTFPSDNCFHYPIFKIEDSDIYLMSQLPDDLQLYRGSYIYCKNNNHQELYYVQPNGIRLFSSGSTLEKVKLNDIALFEQNLNNMLQGNSTNKLYLDKEQVNKLITSNGEHKPLQLEADVWMLYSPPDNRLDAINALCYFVHNFKRLNDKIYACDQLMLQFDPRACAFENIQLERDTFMKFNDQLFYADFTKKQITAVQETEPSKGYFRRLKQQFTPHLMPLTQTDIKIIKFFTGYPSSYSKVYHDLVGQLVSWSVCQADATLGINELKQKHANWLIDELGAAQRIAAIANMGLIKAYYNTHKHGRSARTPGIFEDCENDARKDILEFQLNHGINSNLQFNCKKNDYSIVNASLLYWAVMAVSLQNSKILLEKGADVNHTVTYVFDDIKRPKLNFSPIHMVLAKHNQTLLDMFLATGKVNVNQIINNESLLMQAVVRNFGILELLKIGADPNQYWDGQQNTPLTLAIKNNNAKAIRTLLDAGSSIIKNHLHDTALDIAVINNNIIAIKLILDTAMQKNINPDTIMSHNTKLQLLNIAHKNCQQLLINYLTQTKLNICKNTNYHLPPVAVVNLPKSSTAIIANSSEWYKDINKRLSALKIESAILEDVRNYISNPTLNNNLYNKIMRNLAPNTFNQINNVKTTEDNSDLVKLIELLQQVKYKKDIIKAIPNAAIPYYRLGGQHFLMPKQNVSQNSNEDTYDANHCSST